MTSRACIIKVEKAGPMPGPYKTVKRSRAPTTTESSKAWSIPSSERPASLGCAGPCRHSQTKTDIAAGSKTTTSLIVPVFTCSPSSCASGGRRFRETPRRHAAKASLALPTQQDRYPIRPGSANLARGASNAVDGAACKLQRVATLHPRSGRALSAPGWMAEL
jgi:hypothetical protein